MSQVLNIEQEAENQNALLLWRASNGVSVKAAKNGIKLPDLSLKQFFVETPYQFYFKNYDYLKEDGFHYAPDLSFSYSFLAGIIYDGFNVGRPGCTFCYQWCSSYVYGLKLEREKFDNYLKLFLIPDSPPIELTVWGGGDYFHPRLYGLELGETRKSNYLGMANHSELYQHVASINEVYANSLVIVRGTPERIVRTWYAGLKTYFSNASKYFRLESSK